MQPKVKKDEGCKINKMVDTKSVIGGNLPFVYIFFVRPLNLLRFHFEIQLGTNMPHADVNM